MSITSTSLLTKAQVTPGEKIPTLTVKETNPGETITLDLKGKNIIVRPVFSRFPSYMLMSNVACSMQIGVPGAFTPPCSSQVPGYIEKYDDFKAKGVSNIYVVAVNDAFVTK